MCLALDRGRPGFVRNCTCSALLGWLPRGFSFSLTRLSLSSARFSNSVRLMKNFVTLCKGRIPYRKLPQPLCRNACGLGTAQVWAFPLSLTTTWGISLGVLRCFTSPGCRLFKRLTGCPVKVAPFRDPRVNGCLLLSAAFRSLLRLSSAFSAKAFPSCYVYLNLINPLWTFFTKAFFNSGFPKLFCFIPSLLSWFVRLENEELKVFVTAVF